MPNIAIVWDFDGTLSPLDSTSKVIEILSGEGSHKEFWTTIKSLRGDTKRPKWEHVLAMDAPIWMYSLSRLASKKKIPLNKEFFEKFVIPEISLYAHVEEFFVKLKKLGEEPLFVELSIDIHHFIVSAGLKDLVEQIFPRHLITYTFGCRYEIVVADGYEDEPESVPVFCMDETAKTRSLFEISKGSFRDQKRAVNTRVEERDRFAPFYNMIYIGDGPTDIPALSLVRAYGGIGIVVYDPNAKTADVNSRLKSMRADKRADFITSADFSVDGALFNYIHARCTQIMHRYAAERATID